MIDSDQRRSLLPKVVSSAGYYEIKPEKDGYRVIYWQEGLVAKMHGRPRSSFPYWKRRPQNSFMDLKIMLKEHVIELATNSARSFLAGSSAPFRLKRVQTLIIPKIRKSGIYIHVPFCKQLGPIVHIIEFSIMRNWLQNT